MRKIFARIERFWFEPVGVTGFGLMRVSFGLLALGSFLPQWTQVLRFYGENGLVPSDVMDEFLRTDFRWTIFNWIDDPTFIFAIYLLLIVCLVCATLGIFTRTTLITSVILIFSFHERQPFVLAGGDTLLRNIGFILALSPCHRSYSVWNLRRRWKYWKTHKKDAPSLTMAAWPYRLLLWQIIMMYVGSVWTKVLGTMWWDGSAVGIALHHDHFRRLPEHIATLFSHLGGIETAFVLFSQSLWPLLLLTPILQRAIPPVRRVFQPRIIRRAAIICDGLVHIGILLMMEVGIFSLAVLTSYLGALKDEDFDALRGFLNRRSKKKSALLYDGHCGLCRRSIFILKTLDSLDRLALVDMHDSAARTRVAPNVTMAHLDKAMHVKLRNGTLKTGFRGMRAISWHIPWLWPVAPFLYVPGVSVIGDAVYAKVASRRKRCKHKNCAM